MFDPAQLFEPRKPPRALYPTLRAELDAIVANKKKMSVFGVTPAQIADGDAWWLELLELACERRLLVVLQAEPSRGRRGKRASHPFVFVTRPEELWRVPAILTTYAAGASPTMDLQRSLLLGYTPAQWTRYQAAERQRECAGMNVYTLLSHEQKRRVVAYGQRCFGTAADVEGMTFFAHQRGRPKPNAATLVPRGLTFARTGLNLDAFAALFPRWRTARKVGLHTVRVDRARATTLLDGLADAVQLATARGWTA